MNYTIKLGCDTMKKNILKLLKTSKDFISGEKISEEFGMTRAAIWKYMNALKEDGYEIESISRKGYRLLSSPDILTYEEVEEYLSTDFAGRKIYYFDSIDSTNKRAKEIAFEEPEGAIVIAEEQLQGRGRLGRKWTSPKKKGIYLSMILKPSVAPMKVAKLTLIGAAAISLALDDIGIKSHIKWPNDIVLNGKKVCGILTEMNCELNLINYVIMGIGINVNLDNNDIPDELKDKATSLKIETGENIDRKKLVANILNRFEELYIPFKDKEDISRTIEICRKNSAVIGKEIRVIEKEMVKTAKALDINDDGELVVEYEGGETEVIFSGEISIRGIEGYI